MKKAKKIGVIHTTPATLQSTEALIKRLIDGAEVMNILDDTILKDMAAQNRVDLVRERWINYAEILEKMGAHAVLSACSTVGPFAEEADTMLKIPVVRIDDAMAQKAAETGGNITVLATFKPTLGPTTDLIKRKNPNAQIKTVLIDEAYKELALGNVEKHNQLIADTVKAELENADVIVLAQASMAGALEEKSEKILTSPEMGIMRLRDILG